MEDEKRSLYEERNLLNKVETVQGNLEDIRNIVQLLKMSLLNNEDDPHICRSVDIIDKMLKSVIHEDMGELRNAIVHE